MKKVTKSIFSQNGHEESVRINKFLSDAGVCSRREADVYIAKGEIQIDGETAVVGSKVYDGQKVTLLGKSVSREEKLVLIAFHKPKGVVCTTDVREPDNVIDYLKYQKRIYPIGRLDKDSEGLLLLTNHGDIVNKILRAGNLHEKEYIVRVNKEITAAFLKGMSEGVPVLDTITKPCIVEAVDKTTFRIILQQGLNRQIRRMCEYFEYKVITLQRIRIMNIKLGRLKVGDYRNLTDWELKELGELLKESTNLSEAAAPSFESKKLSIRTESNASVKHASGKRQAKSKQFTKKNETESKQFTKKNETKSKPYTKKNETKSKPYTKKNETESKPYTKKNETKSKPYTKKNETESKPYTKKNETKSKPFTKKNVAGNTRAYHNH